MAKHAKSSTPLGMEWPPLATKVEEGVEKQPKCIDVKKALGSIWHEIMGDGTVKEAKVMFRKINKVEPKDEDQSANAKYLIWYK